VSEANVLPFATASNKTEWADQRALEIVQEAGLQPDVDNLGAAINRVRTLLVAQMERYVERSGRRDLRKWRRVVDPEDDQVIDTAYAAMLKLPKFSASAREIADDQMTALIYGEFRQMLIDALRQQYA
jgi:hypothetical protein